MIHPRVRDGATLSFHHHLRNGDHILDMVLEVAAEMGLISPAIIV
ncbi:citrate lyase subunit alpha [Trinickia mobilis]|nr:citrate lyase subunit alpha [Trinickia mobilis]